MGIEGCKGRDGPAWIVLRGKPADEEIVPQAASCSLLWRVLVIGLVPRFFSRGEDGRLRGNELRQDAAGKMGSVLNLPVEIRLA